MVRADKIMDFPVVCANFVQWHMVSVTTFGVMNIILFPMAENHQIRHQATSNVDSQFVIVDGHFITY